MKRGNAICASGGDDSRFTTIRSVAYQRASETGEDPDLLIKILIGQNSKYNGIDADTEITEGALSLPENWYGFYNPETNTGDFYVGGRTQNQKGKIPEEVKTYNRAKVEFYEACSHNDPIRQMKSLGKLASAWFKTW